MKLLLSSAAELSGGLRVRMRMDRTPLCSSLFGGLSWPNLIASFRGPIRPISTVSDITPVSLLSWDMGDCMRYINN
jgi:hypothetical protein